MGNDSEATKPTYRLTWRQMRQVEAEI